MRRLCLVATLLFTCAICADAQGVPAFSAEISAGIGSHTLVTPRTYYRDRSGGILRIAGTVRLGAAGRVRPILGIEHSPGCGFGWGCGEKLSCEVAPNGTCRQNFGDLSGNAISLGVAGSAGRRLVGAVAAGLGRYEQNARFVDANASLRLFWRVSLMADTRYIWSTDDLGYASWFAPVSFGVRIF